MTLMTHDRKKKLQKKKKILQSIREPQWQCRTFAVSLNIERAREPQLHRTPVEVRARQRRSRIATKPQSHREVHKNNL